jgi:hypothetical protein
MERKDLLDQRQDLHRTSRAIERNAAGDACAGDATMQHELSDCAEQRERDSIDRWLRRRVWMKPGGAQPRTKPVKITSVTT